MTPEQVGIVFRRILTVVLIVFVTLKLAGEVDWPWWVVLLPFLIPAGVAVLCLALVGLATVNAWGRR